MYCTNGTQVLESPNASRNKPTHSHDESRGRDMMGSISRHLTPMMRAGAGALRWAPSNPLTPMKHAEAGT